VADSENNRIRKVIVCTSNCAGKTCKCDHGTPVKNETLCKDGPSLCAACDPGHTLNASNTGCIACAAGRYLPRGSNECKTAPPARWRPRPAPPTVACARRASTWSTPPRRARTALLGASLPRAGNRTARPAPAAKAQLLRARRAKTAKASSSLRAASAKTARRPTSGSMPLCA
jgi:hypothetical protein